MRRSAELLSIAALALGGLAAACGEGGDSAAGVYVLRAMGDSLPPFVEYNSGGYVATLLADTLVLDGRGTVEEATTVRVGAPASPPAVGTSDQQGTYVVRGDTVDLGWVCDVAYGRGAEPRFVAAAGAARPTLPAGPRPFVGAACGVHKYAREADGLTTLVAGPTQPYTSAFYQRVLPLPALR